MSFLQLSSPIKKNRKWKGHLKCSEFAFFSYVFDCRSIGGRFPRCIYGGIWAEMLEDRKFYYPIPGEGAIWKEHKGATVLAALAFKFR
jgi:hypothetical protein